MKPYKEFLKNKAKESYQKVTGLVKSKWQALKGVFGDMPQIAAETKDEREKRGTFISNKAKKKYSFVSGAPPG